MNKKREREREIEIEIEIVSDEEMAVIDAAYALTNALHAPPLCPTTTTTSSSTTCDIEDFSLSHSHSQSQSQSQSFLTRFRNNRAFAVTDLTSTEWCEKQMEFILCYGRPEKTDAMKAGITRHAKLEEEVSKKVEVRVETIEDIWAVKFCNFIACANQLLFDGLTREMPVVGLVQGVWMVGVIDELRLPLIGTDGKLTLVDTKTRTQPRPPAEPQCRNGRLQLMCYKYLWDNLVSHKFPSEQFYEFFNLDPQHILSNEVKVNAADLGFPAETLGELEKYFNNVCSALQPAHDQLLLRYELQEDNSLIYEDEFNYDADWLQAQIHISLEFWRGEREAKFVPEMESWKCRFCKYATSCPKTQTQAQPNPPSNLHNTSQL